MDEPIGKFIFKEVAMLDYKSIVRLKRLGLNNAAIANSLGCKWDSVQRIVSRCENVWGSVDGVPDDLTNEEIADVLFSSRKSVDLNYLQPDCEKILEKQRKGYLRNELWAEYCAEAGTKGKKAYKLSRFNEIVSDYRSKHDISFTMNHVPGLEAQADWAGDKGHFLDCDTGELVEVHVFVMTLPYSGYFYCEGFLDEKMPAWYAGHSNAFAFYGGVPAFIIPDNCATAVDRQHFDEKGILNTRYVEFLTHYGATPRPTRIKKPRDKGHVERHVRIVEDDIIRPMERLDIYSLQEYNDIMRRKLIARNSRDYSKKLGSRTSIFEAEEKQALLPLPVLQYKSYDEKDATVWRDFHIQYDCAFYSVPIRYVGKKVTVKATNEQIRIYYQEKLIAEHRRAVRKWQKSTLEAHIPGKGTDLHGAYSSDELISWAEKFGPYTVRWVKAELGRFEFEVQAYRPVTSVLRILNRYTPEAAESASEAALASSVFTVKGYKSILSAQSRIHPAKANRINLNDVFCAHEDKEGSDYGNS
jgi:transposase